MRVSRPAIHALILGTILVAGNFIVMMRLGS
jgi:hypothetical protein